MLPNYAASAHQACCELFTPCWRCFTICLCWTPAEFEGPQGFSIYSKLSWSLSRLATTPHLESSCNLRGDTSLRPGMLLGHQGARLPP